MQGITITIIISFNDFSISPDIIILLVIKKGQIRIKVSSGIKVEFFLGIFSASE
tara:strand:- start:51 stop:212 length:162 start_codon:yes stop_codon:yes gene_type:complete